MMNNQKHVKHAYKHFRTFKHIQRNLNDYYHALILNSHHNNIKNMLEKEIIPTYNIHTMKEEVLGEVLKNKRDSVSSLNTLNFGKTKI